MPANADLETFNADPDAPFFHQRGFGRQIRQLCRNGVQGGLEQHRQAHERNMAVELVLFTGERDTLQRAHQAFQFFLGRQQHAGAGLAEQGQIAAELDGVAEAAIAMNQDCLAFGFGQPGQRRLGQLAIPRRFQQPPPFIIFPCRRQMAPSKLGLRLFDIGHGKIRLQRDCSVIAGNRLLETPQHVQHDAAIGMARRVRRLQRDGKIAFHQGIPKTIKCLQACGAVAMKLCFLGLQNDGAIEAGKRFIPPPEHQQHAAAIAPGPGKIRLQRDCIFISRESFLMALQEIKHISPVVLS